MPTVPKTMHDSTAAFIFTRHCWRDTPIAENYHAGRSGVCSPEYYAHVLLEVDRRIKRFIPAFCAENKYQETTGKIRNTVVNDTAACYLRDYKEWDKPKTVREKYCGDVARFVLNGAFKEACEKHRVLDDETMCDINHDIYNRFYTLCRRNIIRVI